MYGPTTTKLVADWISYNNLLWEPDDYSVEHSYQEFIAFLLTIEKHK